MAAANASLGDLRTWTHVICIPIKVYDIFRGFKACNVTLCNIRFNIQLDRQRTYNVNILTLSCNYCYRGKAISITYSECVFVALGIHNAMRMRRIILLSVDSPVLPYLSTSSQKTSGFSKKNKKKEVIEHNMCGSIFSTHFLLTHSMEQSPSWEANWFCS